MLRSQVMQAQALEQAGRFGEARDRLTRTLQVAEKKIPDTPDLASILSNLATVESDLGDYTEAERLYCRAVAMFEQTLGKDHIRTFTATMNLAGLYIEVERPSAAERVMQGLLEKTIKQLGPEHLMIAELLEEKGLLRMLERRYDEAASLFLKSLPIYERHQSEMDIVSVLNEIARTEMALGKNSDALLYAERAYAMLQSSAQMHPAPLIKSLNILGCLYYLDGRVSEAEQLLKTAVADGENTYGPNHPIVAHTLNNYSAVLRRLKRKQEAKKAQRRATEILAKNQANNNLGYTVDVAAFLPDKSGR